MALTLQRRKDLLTQASSLISEVFDDLNRNHSQCEACGLKHYEDIEEQKVANRLTGVMTSLSNVATRLGS